MRAMIEIEQGRKVTGIGRYGLNLAESLIHHSPDEVTVAASNQHARRLRRVCPDGNVVSIGRTYDRQKVFGGLTDVVHGINFHAPDVEGARRVATIHDLGFLHLPDHHPHGMPERLDALIRRAIPKTALFICDSHWTRADFVDRYEVEPSRCRVVHLGVGGEFSSHGLGVDGHPLTLLHRIRPPYLLHVGAMIKRKDLPTLLRTFEIVGRQYPRLQLILVGNKTRRWASDWPAVRRWLREHPSLRQRVKVVNYAPQSYLPRLYRDAAALISTSLLEGFGLTILEGSASGVPVVATRGSAVDEVAGPSTYLATARDPQSYAAALEVALMTTPQGRTDAAEHARSFTWTRTGSETLQVYRDAQKAE